MVERRPCKLTFVFAGFCSYGRYMQTREILLCCWWQETYPLQPVSAWTPFPSWWLAVWTLGMPTEQWQNVCKAGGWKRAQYLEDIDKHKAFFFHPTCPVGVVFEDPACGRDILHFCLNDWVRSFTSVPFLTTWLKVKLQYEHINLFFPNRNCGRLSEYLTLLLFAV